MRFDKTFPDKGIPNIFVYSRPEELIRIQRDRTHWVSFRILRSFNVVIPDFTERKTWGTPPNEPLTATDLAELRRIAKTLLPGLGFELGDMEG